MLAGNLLPLATLRVEIINVEPVEVAQDDCVSGRVEGCNCEVTNFFVLGVVESLQEVPGKIVECDELVVSCSHDVLAVGEGVGN